MPLTFPKPERKRNKNRLNFIADLPCCVCLRPADPHHLDSSGTGTKGSDWLTVPLCREHHTELHTIGFKAFESKYGINLWRACATLLAEHAERSK